MKNVINVYYDMKTHQNADPKFEHEMKNEIRKKVR